MNGRNNLIVASILGPMLLSIGTGCFGPAVIVLFGFPDQIDAGMVKEHRDPQTLADTVVEQSLTQSTSKASSRELHSLGLIIRTGDAWGYSIDERMNAVRVTFDAAARVYESSPSRDAEIRSDPLNNIVWTLRRSVANEPKMKEVLSELVQPLEPGELKRLYLLPLEHYWDSALRLEYDRPEQPR